MHVSAIPPSQYRVEPKHLLLLMALLLLVALPHDVWASAGAGGGLPYEDGLAKLRDSVTGPIAFTVSIIGIIAAGTTLIFGQEISGFLRTVLYLILVISIVVGANNFLATMGKGASIAHAAIDTSSGVRAV